MKTLTLKIPESLKMNESEAQLVLAVKLYELGKLSLGQAAKLVGSNKDNFIKQLSNYGVSFFNYHPDEIEEDIKNAEAHSC